MGSDDQRQSTRLPIPQGRDVALLRVGRRSLSAQVLNASAGGFAIRLERHASLATGQTAVLGSAAGWCQVRVVYVRHDEDGVSVGLQRTAELPIDWHRWRILRIWPFHRLRVPLPSLGWSHCALGGLLVCGAVLAAVFWDGTWFQNTRQWVQLGGNMPVFSGRAFTGPSPTLPRDTAATRSPPGSGQNAARRSGSSRGWIEREIERRGDDTTKWLRDSGSSAPKELSDLSADLRRIGEQAQGWTEIVGVSSNELPDASLLLSPDVETKLEITPAQRTEIVSIVRSSNEEVEAVYSNATDARSPAVSFQVMQLRKTASKQAVAVLSSQQRQQLKLLRNR